MSKAGGLLAGFLAFGLVLTGAPPVLAAWNAGSTGSATGLAMALQPPTLPTSTMTVSSVTLNWVAPTTGAVPSGYTVQRTAPTLAAVCVAVAATSCTDSGLAPTTTYTYEITASAGVWQSTALTASATTATPSASAFVVVVPATVTAGSFLTPVTIQAKRSDGSDDTTYTGTKSLTFSGPGSIGSNNPTYPATAVFDANGLATLTNAVTLYKAESPTLTVADPTDAPRTGISGTIAVVPAVGVSMQWTTDAAGLIKACPIGSLVVGAGGQRSWYVGVLDTYGNRAVQGNPKRTVDLSMPSGNGTAKPPGLSILAGANPAVTSGRTKLQLLAARKSPTDTTFVASSPNNPPVTSVSCTLIVV